MRDGYSVTAFAGHIGVARSTVFLWAEQNPEFSDALKTAQALAALWWEKSLRQVASTGEGNATASIFGVKNRSTEDWRDKQEVEHTGKDGGPIETVDRSDKDIARAIGLALFKGMQAAKNESGRDTDGA